MPGEPAGALYIGVIGSSRCDRATASLAYELGGLIAAEGWTLVCGGLGGVMEQACRGARSRGGVTLGILPGNSRAEANPYLSYSVVTGMGEARNVLVVKSSQAAVAVSGSYGTLSEIALANAAGIPVIGLHSWRLDPEHNRGHGLFVREVQSSSEAIQAIKSLFP